MTSPPPSPSSRVLGPPGIMARLKTKASWTPEDLEQLLDEETFKHGLLLAQKEAAETETDRLATGKRDLKGELEHLNKSFTRLKSLMNKITKDKLPNRREHAQFYKDVDKAEELEKAAAYLTVLQFYTATSEQIDANLDSDLQMEAIELFHRLKRIEVAYLDMTDCSHLTTLGKGIVVYWETRLTSKLVKDFEKLLESFGWPMRLKTATPTLETHEKLHRSVMNMTKINCTVHEGEGNSSSDISLSDGDLNEVFVPILPIQVMMVALRRRFRFHFLSDKPTNESSRPEWYFSQVKQWVYDLVPFVKTHLEQVTVSEIGVSSVIEFVRCISEMLILKVDAHLLEDPRDSVFVKVLEESISFENEISDFVIQNVGQSSKSFLPAFVNAIFSRPLILQQWLQAEKRACLEKLDDMFTSPSAWNKPIITHGPPEIVDLFIAVIRSLTDRFAHLCQLPQRLQFLHLLNDLLDEFHVRCLQTWKSKPEIKENLFQDVLMDYIIADSLYSIHHILQEWEYLPFFASLTLVSSSNEEDLVPTSSEHSGTAIESGTTQLENNHQLVDLSKGDGLFSSACSLYWCLADEIQTKWCLKVIKKVKEELQPYAKLKWQSFQALSEHQCISEQILTMLRSLGDLGRTLRSSMDPRTAEKWMKKLAVKLDEMLMETLIFRNQFSPAGVSQLNFDFTKGIFPLFIECGVNEKLFFGSIVSALKILRLSTGEAMLLYDTLMNGNFEAHEVALAELGIAICQSEVIKVLRNRCDLRI